MAMMETNSTDSGDQCVGDESCTKEQTTTNGDLLHGNTIIDDDIMKTQDSASCIEPGVIEEETEEDSSEGSRSDDFLRALLNPAVTSPASSNTASLDLPNISGLTLVDRSNSSLDNSTCSQRRLQDQQWTTNSSVHSESEASAADKKWKTLDSVHSRASTSERGPAGSATLTSDIGNSSMDFNDSCCSFASFGNSSDGSLGESGSDLMLQRAAFTRLSEEPTPRRLLMKAQSVRVTRGRSFRGSNLTLIDESNSLD